MASVAEILGANLRNIRRARGLTMKQLGEAAGITETSIGLYETAKRLPPIDKIFRIANVLDVSTSELLEETHGKKKEDAAVFEHRFNRAINFAMDAGFSPTVSGDRKVTIAAPLPGNSVTFKDIAGFVQFIENAETLAISQNVLFRRAAMALIPIFESE